MAWTLIEHSCGHTARHQLYGPGKTREWRAKCLAEESCDDCAQAARDAANAAAAQANAAAGLPALTGTDKQIAWAETIRAHKLDLLGQALTGELSGIDLAAFWGTLNRHDPRLPFVVDALQAQAAAAWWIDHRELKVGDLLLTLAAELPREPAAKVPDATAVDVLAESTLRPAAECTATVAEIRIDGARIAVAFPEKRDDFRALVKGLGYRWDASLLVWTRIIDEWSGPLGDRIAEVGNALLTAGFCIRIQDPVHRAAAQGATFAPECKRWVRARTGGRFAGWLVLSWPREDNLYDAAKALPGARYDKPDVVVPDSQYEAIEDFAEAQGMAISPGARAVLDAAREAHDRALLAVPARAPRAAKGRGSMPPVGGDIDASLLDA